MPAVQDAPSVFDRDFLGLRGKIIEVAATLDRIARASGSAESDPRLEQVRQSLALWLGARKPPTTPSGSRWSSRSPMTRAGGRSVLSRTGVSPVNCDSRTGVSPVDNKNDRRDASPTCREINSPHKCGG